MRRWLALGPILLACSGGAAIAVADAGADGGAAEDAGGPRYVDVPRTQPCLDDSCVPSVPDSGFTPPPCVPQCQPGAATGGGDLAYACENGAQLPAYTCDGLYRCRCGAANGPPGNDPGPWCNCVRIDSDY